MSSGLRFPSFGMMINITLRGRQNFLPFHLTSSCSLSLIVTIGVLSHDLSLPKRSGFPAVPRKEFQVPRLESQTSTLDSPVSSFTLSE